MFIITPYSPETWRRGEHKPRHYLNVSTLANQKQSFPCTGPFGGHCILGACTCHNWAPHYVVGKASRAGPYKNKEVLPQNVHYPPKFWRWCHQKKKSPNIKQHVDCLQRTHASMFSWSTLHSLGRSHHTTQQRPTDLSRQTLQDLRHTNASLTHTTTEQILQ
jgi:hypothetical protein